MQIALKSFFMTSAIAFAASSISAEQCPTNDNKVIYVNGIQNTLKIARKSQLALQNTLNNSNTRANQDKKKFSVGLIWNPNGFTGKGSVITTLPQDLRELMIEKTSEELFADDFKKLLSPHNSPKVIDKAAAQRVKQYLDDMTPGVTTIEDKGDITDANLKATQNVVKSLVSEFNTNKRVIVVAHSQGNLLANLAWATYAADVASNPNQNVRIVNVGNTSQFSVNGLNLTHFSDHALGELIQLPKTKSWKRTTPNCSNDLCEFQVASATFKGADGGDFLNHGFAETYLSTLPLPDVADDQGVTFTAGKNRFADRLEDLVYAATSSLDKAQGFTSEINACIIVDTITCSRVVVQNGSENGLELTHWKVKGYVIIPENRLVDVQLTAAPNILTLWWAGFSKSGEKVLMCPSWVAQAYRNDCTASPTDPNKTDFTFESYGDKEANGYYFDVRNTRGFPDLNGTATHFMKGGLSCPGSYTFK